MDRRYERILKKYGFSYFEYRDGGRLFYDITGFLVHFQCPADCFPESFVQYCLAYKEDEELEKEIREKKTVLDELISMEADYRETEEILSAIAVLLINAERYVKLEKLTAINRTILYLLSETNSFVSQDEAGLYICHYTEFGAKFRISCRDANYILEDVRNTCRSYDQQKYFTEQVKRIEKGERVRIPTAQLVIESEMVQSFLEDLLDELEELRKEDEDTN